MKKSADTKRLILLDVHAIIHRAYHALPDFVSSKGQPTGALYGLSTMLMKIITDLKPDYIVAAYDLPQKTFRHAAYKEYKAGRAKTDDNLVIQIKESRSIFEAFNIPMYEAPGFEADDVIGTIVEFFKKDKVVDIVIASGDMDTMQLVDNDHVQVFTLKKGINDTILYNEKAMIERFSFPPPLLPDYKGLRGDPSDNIIGIKGIGEKTATELIVRFGTIEEIYKKLASNESVFKESGFSDRMIQLLKDGEEEALFSKVLATIRRDAPINFVLPETTFLLGIDIQKIEKIFHLYEFRSLIPRIKHVLGQDSSLSTESLEKEQSIDPEEFKKLRIALWLLNSEMTNITTADILSFSDKGDFKDAKEHILKEIKEKGLEYMYSEVELPLIPITEEMRRYGLTMDVEYLKKLSLEYHKELSTLEKSIWRLAGHEFNINSPKQLGDILFDELQVGEGSMRLKKTAGGARSTRESELSKMKDSHPIISEILKYRELQKLLSTYIDTLPELLGVDGKVHATFNQAGATTGRFSSQDPNLQNIPIRTEVGKKIRDAFVAQKGYKLISFDYSQIELRIAALLSQDEFMTKVFTEGKDVHAAVAAKVFGVSEKNVDHEMRRRAKIINFGILYGMGVTALRENLGTDRKTAQEFYDNYFAQFPKISGYLEDIKTSTYKRGYTETLFGRRRYFPSLKSKLPYIRAMAERMTINAPIQGTAADCIKIAIRDVARMIEEKKLTNEIHLILQVHDELVYEVKEALADSLSHDIEEIMKNVISKKFLKNLIPVPLEVHVSKGNHWGELK